MKLDRLHRILQLVTVLQSGTDMTAADLAEEMGVSRRTIFRDLKIIEQAGIPYYGQPGGGYRISSCFFLPPTNLEVSEAIGLTLLAKTAANQQHQPFSKPAIRAIRKMLATMNEPVREVCSEMSRHISLNLAAPVVSSAPIDHFTVLLRATNERLVVELAHLAIDPATAFNFRPMHLRLDDRIWYVIGYHEGERRLMTLRLDDIASCRLTQRTFKADRPFDVTSHIGKAWRMQPEGQLYQIEVEFDATLGKQMAAVFWHPTQKHRLYEDGRNAYEFSGGRAQ